MRQPLLHKPSRSLPKRLAVIGVGTIGPDIGYYLKAAIPDLILHLVDIAQASLDRAIERFKSYAQKGSERGKIREAQEESPTRWIHS